jgi:hypothetical protein
MSEMHVFLLYAGMYRPLLHSLSSVSFLCTIVYTKWSQSQKIDGIFLF